MIGAVGKLVALTVNAWDGPLPLPGSYVKSARGRTAFEVIEFRPSRPSAKMLGRLVCKRIEAKEVPQWATVHEWRWARR